MGQVFGEALGNKKEKSRLWFFLCPDKQYPSSQSLLTNIHLQQAQMETPIPQKYTTMDSLLQTSTFETHTRFFCKSFALSFSTINTYKFT